jgi:hypothetical protein
MTNLRTHAVLAILLASALPSCASTVPAEAYRGYEGHLSKMTASPNASPVFRPCNPAQGDTLWLASFANSAKDDRARLESTGVINLPSGVFVRVNARVRDNLGSHNPFGNTRTIEISRVIQTKLGGSCDDHGVVWSAQRPSQS